MSIRFDKRVAIVTGGGNGLGKEYCLALAKLGARVVVNDLGGALDGSGASSAAAEAVVTEIRDTGGDAIADDSDVTNREQVDAMVKRAMEKWGRVDILINNAGILRDKTFAKGTIEDFKKVVDVHLFGAVNCTKAVWNIMREQNYGRIMMTSSSSGIFGNFGQSNYGAAKTAMIGFMNVLYHEGKKYDIRVNTLAPAAATRMTEGLSDEEDVEGIGAPALIAPGVLYLVSENAPTKTILGAELGCFSEIHIYQTKGAYLGGATATVDDVAANWANITDPVGEAPIDFAGGQSESFLKARAETLGLVET